MLYLALDQGGHASRALLFDGSGQQVATAHVPVATRHEGLSVEHDADELARSLELAAADVLESLPARDRSIAAAGLATQRSTIVCWERKSSKPLSAAVSWQDRRAHQFVEGLRALEPRIRELSGLVLSPHYGASKLRWCLDNLQPVQLAARRGDLLVGPLSSFLLARLLTERPALTDPANAARTQLYDPARGDWSPTLLELFGVPRELLPTCVPTLHEFGTLALARGACPLRACTGDQAAAAFAFGPPREDTVYVNVGTGAFIQRIVPPGTALPDGLLKSVLMSDGKASLYSLEGTVNGAGSAIDWLRGEVALDVDRTLAALTESTPAQTPLFLNGIGGLGAPYWRHDFQSEFIGPGDEQSRVRAVVESVAFLLCVNLERMNGDRRLERIVISGGLARCDYLCQALAGLSGLRVERMRQCEATARGVAFLAAGLPEGWTDVPLDRSFEVEAGAALAARFAEWRAELERRLD
jgi:glycerol kinase